MIYSHYNLVLANVTTDAKLSHTCVLSLLLDL